MLLRVFGPTTIRFCLVSHVNDRKDITSGRAHSTITRMYNETGGSRSNDLRRSPTTMIKLQFATRHFAPMNRPKRSRYESGKRWRCCCRYWNSCDSFDLILPFPSTTDSSFSLYGNSRETGRRVLVRGNEWVACVSSCRKNVRHSPWHCLSSFVERYARRASTRDKLKRGFCSRALSLPRFPLWGRMSDSVCHSTTRVYLFLSLSFPLLAFIYACIYIYIYTYGLYVTRNFGTFVI